MTSLHSDIRRIVKARYRSRLGPGRLGTEEGGFHCLHSRAAADLPAMFGHDLRPQSRWFAASPLFEIRSHLVDIEFASVTLSFSQLAEHNFFHILVYGVDQCSQGQPLQSISFSNSGFPSLWLPLHCSFVSSPMPISNILPRHAAHTVHRRKTWRPKNVRVLDPPPSTAITRSAQGFPAEHLTIPRS